jgi:hypothetical protein
MWSGAATTKIFNLGDRFAAIDAACPHRGGPLCDGIVTGTGAPSPDCAVNEGVVEVAIPPVTLSNVRKDKAA